MDARPEGMRARPKATSMFQQVMLKNYGIPHWGKKNNVLDADPAYLQTLYPKLKDWKKVIKQMNPNGTFSNSFSERLQLTT